MTELSVGMALEWGPHENDEVHLTRILWLSPPRNVVVLFDIVLPNALPEFINMDELLSMIDSGVVKPTTVFNEKNVLKDNDIRDTYRRRRDKAWETIKVIASDEPAIYDEHQRWSLITTLVHETGVSRQQIYAWLRKYWRNGKTINALLPDYDKCGGSRVDSNSASKVGRIGLRARANSELRGIPITPDIQNIFQIAIDKWYHFDAGLPLTKVFNKMLGMFFNSGYEEKEGIFIPILKPPEERPTIRQFRYWYHKTADRERELRTRYGSTTYEQKFRPILGTTDHESLGPGHIFQIDATIADIWLVHRYNRLWLIGKPILYFVVDLFSRLIAGLYVGLEGPSWLGAMMALENATSDKVEYCAAHGIKISKETWPAHYLPEILTSDRGEFEGTRPTNLIQTLHTDVQTLPPYRPDWKPVVERRFRLANDDVIRWLPGNVPERATERGSRNYQLDALFDIEEFEQIMIRMVLKYNNHHVLSNYQRTKNMLSDDVPPIPIHLWNWGRKKEYNGLHTFPQDVIRLNLLPMKTVRVTRQGIRLNNRFYLSQTAIKEQWFVANRPGAKARSVDVHYDPRNTDIIYLRKDNGKGYEPCHLADIHARYKGLRDEEARDINSYENLQKREYTANDEAQANVELDAHIDAKIRHAQSKRRYIPKKAIRRENVREHRSNEKELERQERAWRMEEGSNSLPNAENVVVFSPDSRSQVPDDEADYSELVDEILELKGDDEQ